MKRLFVFCSIALLVLGAMSGAVAHPKAVTDDPTDTEEYSLDSLLQGSPSVTALHIDPPTTTRAERRARNISLVGSLELEPSSSGAHADVAAYRDLAFVGKWAGPCPGTGIDIIDISDPSDPVKLASTADRSGTSMEDMQAIRVAGMDVLATGLQDCLSVDGDNLRGLELFDISDPANPQFLSFFEVGSGVPFHPGVHEFDLTTTPGGPTLALLAVPDLEAATASPPSFDNGQGDLLIVDISDPANPELIADWGVLQEPALGLDFYLDVQQGEHPATFLHSVRANANGTRAYLSYWDAGFIILDISDPTNPTFLGVTEYPPDAEGNAHSVDEARGGNILIGADEDFSPFSMVFRVTAPEVIAGEFPAAESNFTAPIADLPGATMAGEVVHIGRGCPEDPENPDVPIDGDVYLDDPTGKIALIERGACRFDNKVAWAQINGAIGAIVYDNQPGLLPMGGDNPVVAGSPDVIGTTITIPGISVEQATGLAMIEQLDANETVQMEAATEFVGWGFLRFYDISNPSAPVEIGTFATENTFNPDVATEGIWSVHNPEVRGNTLYASWYSDGVRVIDISRPAQPREIGFWTGQGAPEGAPAVDIWSVVPHQDVLIASDRNYGLYILKHVPPRGRP